MADRADSDGRRPRCGARRRPTTSTPRSRSSARCCCRATPSRPRRAARRRRRLLQAGPPARLRGHPGAGRRRAGRRGHGGRGAAPRGLLDAIGGRAFLLELQAATPAISNAGRYARIVQDTALLRRLIGVAGEIAEIGYEEPDDVTKALDRPSPRCSSWPSGGPSTARSRSATCSTGHDRPRAGLRAGQVAHRHATGYIDLDELLSGLQPSTLNVVGARPSMGKCVAWDTELVDPATGELVTAAELHMRGATGRGCRSSRSTLTTAAWWWPRRRRSSTTASSPCTGSAPGSAAPCARRQPPVPHASRVAPSSSCKQGSTGAGGCRGSARAGSRARGCRAGPRAR